MADESLCIIAEDKILFDKGDQNIECWNNDIERFVIGAMLNVKANRRTALKNREKLFKHITSRLAKIDKATCKIS